MKTLVRCLLALLAIAASQSLRAEETAASFLGIPLGVPLDGRVPECPKTDMYGRRPRYDTTEIYTAGKLCYKIFPGSTNYEVVQTPRLGFRYETTICVFDGKAECVAVEFDHTSFPKMQEMLVAKFGAPDKIEERTYTTRGGTEVKGAVYNWRRMGVDIRASEYQGSLMKSGVFLETPTLAEQHKHKQDEEAKRNAEKL
jgi:hypothetical protein